MFTIYSARPCRVRDKFRTVALHEGQPYRDNLGNVHSVPKTSCTF